VQPKRDAIVSPYGICVGVFEQAFFTHAQLIAYPNPYPVTVGLDADPDVLSMQQADDRLEVEPCHCQVRLLRGSFPTHSAPDDT